MYCPCFLTDVKFIVTELLNKEMYFLQNKSKESVKETLLELLNHRNYVDRSFKALSERIGGYNDKELRLILNEVGAVKVNKKDAKDGKNEWWYLKDRKGERDEMKKKKVDKRTIVNDGDKVDL